MISCVTCGQVSNSTRVEFEFFKILFFFWYHPCLKYFTCSRIHCQRNAANLDSSLQSWPLLSFVNVWTCDVCCDTGPRFSGLIPRTRGIDICVRAFGTGSGTLFTIMVSGRRNSNPILRSRGERFIFCAPLPTNWLFLVLSEKMIYHYLEMVEILIPLIQG